MFHASNFTYVARDQVEDIVFDEAQDILTPTLGGPAAPQPAAKQQRLRRRRIRKATTNVLAARLGTLGEGADVATGDPCCCAGCGAYLSAISKLQTVTKEEADAFNASASSTTTSTTTSSSSSPADEEKRPFEEGDKVWTCEFCGVKNLVHLDEEELPKSESVDYILEAAPEATSDSGGSSPADESVIVFCIDVSGSMCVTTEVHGKLKLKGNNGLDKLAALNTERVNQFAPRQKRDVTYISRLQAVTAAVDAQLERMEKDHPNRKVALVTFNGEVAIVGDGTQRAETVAGDKLHDVDALARIGSSFDLSTPVSSARAALGRKLFELEEGGPTALGPALVVSVAMASRARGSKVVLCTDGCANVGVGALDELTESPEDDARREEIRSFYRSVADRAVQSGVTVSVISIKGDACKLEEIGSIADATNGDVDIVDPLELTKNFSNILASPVIATNVQLKLLLHRGLFVRDPLDEDDDDDDDDAAAAADAAESDPQTTKKEEQLLKKASSHVTRDVGNITAESEVTFEYGVKPIEEMKKENVDHQSLKELPFQLQIRYQKLDGMKCVRLISKLHPITFDAEQAEREADVDVLGLNAIQQGAQLAQQGRYGTARAYNKINLDMMSRAARTEQQARQFRMWSPQAQQLETALHCETVNEINEGLDLEDDALPQQMSGEEKGSSNNKPALKEALMQRRKARRGDGVANVLYQMTSKSAKKYAAQQDDQQ